MSDNNQKLKAGDLLYYIAYGRNQTIIDIRTASILSVGNKFYTIDKNGAKKISISTLMFEGNTFGQFDYQFFKTLAEAEEFTLRTKLITSIYKNASYDRFSKLSTEELQTINDIISKTTTK